MDPGDRSNFFAEIGRLSANRAEVTDLNVCLERGLLTVVQLALAAPGPREFLLARFDRYGTVTSPLTDRTLVSEMKWGFRCKLRFHHAFLKYMIMVMGGSYALIPSFANANQIAQSLIQLALMALSYPTSVTTGTCTLAISTFDPTTFSGFSMDVQIDAAVANNVISCTIIAPYYWSLAALIGKITMGYAVSAQNGSAVVKTNSGSFNPIRITTTGAIPVNISTIF